MSQLFKATIIETGKEIKIYKRSSDGQCVDYSDCKILYNEEELKIGNLVKDEK